MENEKLTPSLQNVKVLMDPQSIIFKKNADVAHYLHYGYQKAFLQNIKSELAKFS